MKSFKNEAEVEKYFVDTKNKVIIFEGTVYEIGDYMSQHPGGPELIENLLGKSIDEPFEEAEHTKSARNIFRDLKKVGYLDGNGNPDEKEKVHVPIGMDGFKLESKIKIDYNRGIFSQIYQSDMTLDEYI